MARRKRPDHNCWIFPGTPELIWYPEYDFKGYGVLHNLLLLRTGESHWFLLEFPQGKFPIHLKNVNLPRIRVRESDFLDDQDTLADLVRRRIAEFFEMRQVS
mgnify:CR=1 FL=1